MESRLDQLLTRRVALRRKSAGRSSPIAPVAISASTCGVVRWPCPTCRVAPTAGQQRSAVHEKVLCDLPFLHVQIQYGALQHALPEDATGLDRQRPAEPTNPPALINMPRHGPMR